MYDAGVIITEWINILKFLQPNSEKMTPNQHAHHLLSIGKFDESRKLLEEIAKTQGVKHELFGLLLKCYTQLGLRAEYRELHSHYGDLLEIPRPNFNSLNSFLKIIDDSVFMIQVFIEGKGVASGSGFSVGKNMIITNRHVIENAKSENIQIIGKHASCTVDKVFKDPTN